MRSSQRLPCTCVASYQRSSSSQRQVVKLWVDGLFNVLYHSIQPCVHIEGVINDAIEKLMATGVLVSREVHVVLEINDCGNI